MTTVLTLPEVQARVLDYIAREFLEGDATALDLDTQLLALGIIDSLKMLKLTTFIETDFGILLDIEHLVPTNLESIRAISGMIHGLLGSGVTTT